MIFTCEVTNRGDGIGVEWVEARAEFEWCLIQLGSVIFSCSIFGILWALAAMAIGKSPAWLILAAMINAGSYKLMWFGWRIAGRPRAIYFKRSGTIESPHGLFDGSKVVGPWKTQIGDIANIEMEQIVFPKPDEHAPYTHGVRMILKTGRVFHVAGNLMPDHAHELAVSLSQAREAMRYDVSTASPRARSREAVY